MEATYQIGLGNHDIQTRKSANNDYVRFWEEQAKNLHWFDKWNKTLEWNPPFAKWFVGGTINASYNALDVIVQKYPQKKAFFWEGE
ncbi:MAG TPA: acetyl-coenzyme A synthetase N-terminal domain-containing protein, partial [Candidatus Bathyarchaeia archaeon]|nr:acetyl-coenzyme A synthetase N-terminal domain-containing protein [Candidatus Bathyarchaeia archaeon]